MLRARISAGQVALTQPGRVPRIAEFGR